MSGFANDGMDKGSMMESEDRIERLVDIYISAEAVRDMKHKKNTENCETQTKDTQTSQHTGSDSVRVIHYRAAAVCLGLLCVLLLTAVIALSVYFYMNNTKYTQETHKLLTRITELTEKSDELTTNITNLTEERRELTTNITNLTEERSELKTNITNLTEERRELRTNITNLTEERRELRTNITNLTEERRELKTNITNLTEERDGLIITNRKLLNEKDQLKQKNENMTNARNQFNNTLQTVDGWTYYQYSFYYMSNETKNWSESRRDCRNRKADLVIINNKEEQDFIMNITRNQEFFIGVTDNDVEGRWKWVDGTNMTSEFWASYENIQEPDGKTGENCVVTHLKKNPELDGWIDISCNNPYQWICEKSILPLIRP